MLTPRKQYIYMYYRLDECSCGNRFTLNTLFIIEFIEMKMLNLNELKRTIFLFNRCNKKKRK